MSTIRSDQLLLVTDRVEARRPAEANVQIFPEADTSRRSAVASAQAPTVSVVVPAHDEAATIGATLDALRSAAEDEVLQVVVVANGCTDATAAVARAAGADVVEIDEASKVAALRAGDRATDLFPRIYLDADIRLTPGAVDALAAVLRSPEPLIAAPQVDFDTTACSWPVRAFYRAFAGTPYVADGLVGLGIYGMSQAGRARFDVFPDVRGDDLFVQRLFAAQERRTTAGRFVVSAPRDVLNLLKVRTRIAQGNAELADLVEGAEEPGRFDRSTGATGRALIGAVARRPAALPDVAVYVAITALTRVLARRRSTASWQRDSSTR